MSGLIKFAALAMICALVSAQAPVPDRDAQTPNGLNPMLAAFCVIGTVKSVGAIRGYIQTRNIAYLVNLLDDLKVVLIACTQAFSAKKVGVSDKCREDIAPLVAALQATVEAAEARDLARLISKASRLYQEIQNVLANQEQIQQDCGLDLNKLA